MGVVQNTSCDPIYSLTKVESMVVQNTSPINVALLLLRDTPTFGFFYVVKFTFYDEVFCFLFMARFRNFPEAINISNKLTILPKY